MTILFGQTVYGLVISALFALVIFAAVRRFLLTRYQLAHDIDGYDSFIRKATKWVRIGLVTGFVILIYREIRKGIRADNFKLKPLGMIYSTGKSGGPVLTRTAPFTISNVGRSLRSDAVEFEEQLRYVWVNEPYRLLAAGALFVVALIYSAQRIKEPGEEWAGLPTSNPNVI